MNIAMLSEWRYPLLGGGQLYTKDLCEYLVKKHSCKVDVFTRAFVFDDNKIYKKNDHLEWWKLNIFRIWPVTTFFNIFWRLAWLIAVTVFLYKKAKKEKYDIIHAHSLTPWLPAKIIGLLLKIPVVFSVHGTMHLDTNKRWLLYRGEKFFVTKIKYDLEMSDSHNILKYKNRNKNIIVMRTCVDHKRFQLNSLPEKYKWNNFLFIGRLNWQKWIEYLLEWIGKIDKEFLREKEFHLNVVGDWELREKIENLILKYGIKEFITMKWSLYGEIIVKEYYSNQVFILPSLAEWQPLVIFEAFICKLPVIATDVGDNKYFIKNWETGLLLPPWNSDKIKEAIENILNLGKEKIDSMWKNWYDLTINWYTWDIMVDRVYEQYKLLLK